MTAMTQARASSCQRQLELNLKASVSESLQVAPSIDPGPASSARAGGHCQAPSQGAYQKLTSNCSTSVV